MSQEFDNNALNLVKQKRFYAYEYMRVFGEFKEQLPGKEKFYSSLTGTIMKMSDKEYEHVLKIWNKLEVKKMKDYHDLIWMWRFTVSICF